MPSDTPVEVDEEADRADGRTPGDDEQEGFSRARGPFDASEVDEDDNRIDLGALRVPPVDGMELRLELDQEQQSVVSAHAVLGDSAVQLQAFAAPRTLGVWPDIRSEIADTVVAQGGSAQVVDGPLGRELAATIPSRAADGRTFENRVRFLGVDGPRWFLRAVISGAAAVEEAKAAPLLDLVRSVVVVRDDEARPPREALPLRLPPTAQPGDGIQLGDGTEPVDGTEPDRPAAAGTARRVEDLKPFERGPEITEVR